MFSCRHCHIPSHDNVFRCKKHCFKPHFTFVFLFETFFVRRRYGFLSSYPLKKLFLPPTHLNIVRTFHHCDWIKKNNRNNIPKAKIHVAATFCPIPSMGFCPELVVSCYFFYFLWVWSGFYSLINWEMDFCSHISCCWCCIHMKLLTDVENF